MPFKNLFNQSPRKLVFILSSILIILFDLAGCSLLGAKQAAPPAIEWDPSPDAIMAQTATPIKSYHPTLLPDYTHNYIPEGRLFGDGHIVWATYADDGSRTVMEGYLTQEQMTSLLQDFIDTGFFSWDDAYTSRLPYDNPPSDYLTVNLKSVQKTVSVTMTEPPEGYRELFNRLSSGAGALGTPYQPKSGTLILEETQGEPFAIWDNEKYPLDLNKAAEGLSLEGEALQVAWELVNRDPLAPPVVKIGEKNYKVFLLIPGLMYETN